MSAVECLPSDRKSNTNTVQSSKTAILHLPVKKSMRLKTRNRKSFPSSFDSISGSFQEVSKLVSFKLPVCERNPYTAEFLVQSLLQFV